jgi:hypothetical protein
MLFPLIDFPCKDQMRSTQRRKGAKDFKSGKIACVGHAFLCVFASLRRVILGFGLAISLTALAGEVRILVQSSPLAGFRYYAGETLWHEMREGDRLTLVRETDNEHDGNAVRVEWRGQKLGYLPRAQNRAVAAALDNGEAVDARIAKLRQHRNPWQRVLIEVFVVL